MLRTGAPWRDLPEQFGPWSTVYSRFRRWTAAGVWQQILEVLQREADAKGQLDWSTHFIDATIVRAVTDRMDSFRARFSIGLETKVVSTSHGRSPFYRLLRAHQHAAGAVGGQDHEALGRSRGGFSTKIHLRAEGGGKPVAVILSGGERHESLYVESLLAEGRVRRAGPGRPRQRPARLIGDKGYSYLRVRRLLARRGIQAVIPRRKDQRPFDRRHHFDRVAYRERNRVERLIGRLKQHRRIATRYDKQAASYRAMWMLGFILLWL